MEGFKSKDVGMRVQKKILSHMANKSIAKVFIDDNSASILDNFYKLAKRYTGSKKEAEKLVKDIIKIVIKLSVLYRHSQLTDDDFVLAKKFEVKFNAAVMAIISFHEVDFSYDRIFITQHLNDCHSALSSIVKRHLTEKSVGRVDHVFSFFANPHFLDTMFKRNSDYRDLIGNIVKDMNIALDNKAL